MSKKKKKVNVNTKTEPTTSLVEDILQEFEAAEREQAKFRDDKYFSWEDREKMLMARPNDSIGKTLKSQVYDPRMSNEAFDGMARVMASFPTGKVQALNSKDDAGKNVLMNKILTNYVQENANYQLPFLTKLRIIDLMSRVYGSYPALIEYRVDDDYVGPDIFLINPRNFYWQAGRPALNLCQYCFVETWRPMEWLLKRDKNTWTNIDKLYELTKDKDQAEKINQSYNETQYQDSTSEARGKYVMIRLLTKYEKDRWVTINPETKLELRDIENRNQNEELPVKMKHYFPLPDRMYALGMFERGKSLQYAHNSLINLYLEGVKKGLFDTTIVNPNGVVTSTLESMYKPAGIVYETIPNSIRTLGTNPQGLNTFISTTQYMIAAMQNLNNSYGGATVARSDDPSQGKTPEALKLQSFRQSVSDSQDQFQMEEFIQEVYNTFADMLCTKQDKPINLQLFKNDIEEIGKYYPDVTEVYGSKSFATMPVTKDMIGDTKYRYTVDSGSTLKKDNELENKNLGSLLSLFVSNDIVRQKLAEEGKTFNVSEIIKRLMITSGTRDWDNILTDITTSQPMVGGQGPQIPEYQDPQVNEVAQMIQQLGGTQNGR